MRKILTTTAILAAMTLPVFAQSYNAPAATDEGQATVKARTDMKQNPGSRAMGQGVVINRSTTGSAARDAAARDAAARDATNEELNKEENGSPFNPGEKTGVSSGGGDR